MEIGVLWICFLANELGQMQVPRETERSTRKLVFQFVSWPLERTNERASWTTQSAGGPVE